MKDTSVRQSNNKISIAITNQCVDHLGQVYAQHATHVQAAHGMPFVQCIVAALHLFAGRVAGTMAANPDLKEEDVLEMARLNFEQGFEQGKAARELELRGGELDG